MIWLMLTGGLLLLWAGGEAFVRGSVGVARALGLSPLLIGLTLVGFGTSLPELVTSLSAALAGDPGLAVANVIGSNIANILLILGVAAAVAPVAVARGTFGKDAGVLLVVTVGAAGMIYSGDVGRISGALLLAAIVAYLGATWLREKSRPGSGDGAVEAEVEDMGFQPRSVWAGLAIAAAGLAVVVGGAYLFVQGAIDLARTLGVPSTVIGLTVVAVGTSLPELAITLVACLRRQGDVALGNIVGSCLFNLLAILGITALVHPIAVPDTLQPADLLILLGTTLLMILMALTGSRISRPEGVVLLSLFAAYMTWHAVTGA
jgi:cation:H+ antiporter